jgi:RsiW-degrading membrane proteinase PrsW (M82 family)
MMATGVAVRREPVPPLVETPDHRVFWRPRKWTFWVYVGLIVASIVPLLGLAFSPAGALPWGITTFGVAANLVLGVVLVLLIRWLDVYRGIPTPLLVGAFAWGAVVAIGWAVVTNDNVLALATKLLGGAAGSRWGPAISAPVVEEALKIIGVAAVILIGREFVRRPTHGMFIGAFCGLGFQLVENVLYVVQNAFTPAASSDFVAMLPVVVTRSLTAFDSHWLMTAMTGLALGYALTRYDRSWARRLLVVAVLFGVAWWMHFFKDSPLIEDQLPGAALADVAAIGKSVPNLILGFIVYRIAMRAEWRHYAATVDAEPADVITRTEVESMRTRRSRRNARRRHSRHGRKPARRAARRLQRCQLQLANDVETDPGAAARTRGAIRELRSRLPEANQPTNPRPRRTG